MNKKDEQLAQRAKDAFDRSVDGLDAARLSRLNRARHAALAELDSSRRQWVNWIPAAGVAAAVLLAVFVLRTPAEFDGVVPPTSDLEILLSEENIEMLEDLEFYSWLDTLELENDEVGSSDLG